MNKPIPITRREALFGSAAITMMAVATPVAPAPADGILIEVNGHEFLVTRDAVAYRGPTAATLAWWRKLAERGICVLDPETGEPLNPGTGLPLPGGYMPRVEIAGR